MLYVKLSVLIRDKETAELTDPYVFKGIACMRNS